LKPRELVYLPWENIATIVETEIYERDPDDKSYWIYPALCVSHEKDGKAYKHYFSGACLGLTTKENVASDRLDLQSLTLGGLDDGPFRIFKNACAEFKPVKSMRPKKLSEEK
jgi:hypothetical protein